MVDKKNPVECLNPHTVNAAEIGLVMSVDVAPTVHSVLIIAARVCLLHIYEVIHFFCHIGF